MKKIINDINIAANKYAQVVSFQAADVQVALGQSENGGSGSNRDYYASNTINSIITDLANKFNIDDNTKGNININCQNGNISFIVQLTSQNKLILPISNYLKAKFSADMSRKIQAYCTQKKITIGTAVANWINF